MNKKVKNIIKNSLKKLEKNGDISINTDINLVVNFLEKECDKKQLKQEVSKTGNNAVILCGRKFSYQVKDGVVSFRGFGLPAKYKDFDLIKIKAIGWDTCEKTLNGVWRLENLKTSIDVNIITGAIEFCKAEFGDNYEESKNGLFK